MYTIQKIPPNPSNPKSKESTWERVSITQERISQEDISAAMSKLIDNRCTLQEKKACLNQAQQGQITSLLDNLMTDERDENFEWSLAQLDQTFKTSWFGQREVTTITVYVKRAPVITVNPFTLLRNLERSSRRSSISSGW
jgi:hypothetical protein